jgi:hypothetical protein
MPWRPVPRSHAIAALIGLALLALWMAVDDDAYLRPLDDANLAFHEAGHPIYGLFGETLALYGGTLGQLTFPAVAAATFFLRRERVGTAVALAWLGQNCGNIARYVADARAQELPLVGGGEHDWFHILSRWHALDADHTVAAGFRLIGWALVLGAALWLAWPLRPRATGSSGS